MTKIVESVNDEKEFVSKEDLLQLELFKTKVELAKSNAQKAMLEVNLLNSEYKELTRSIQTKYNLGQTDAVQDDGTIVRGPKETK